MGSSLAEAKNQKSGIQAWQIRCLAAGGIGTLCMVCLAGSLVISTLVPITTKVEQLANATDTTLLSNSLNPSIIATDAIEFNATIEIFPTRMDLFVRLCHEKKKEEFVEVGRTLFVNNLIRSSFGRG